MTNLDIAKSDLIPWFADTSAPVWMPYILRCGAYVHRNLSGGVVVKVHHPQGGFIVYEVAEPTVESVADAVGWCMGQLAHIRG